jgi:hypothetical protein
MCDELSNPCDELDLVLARRVVANAYAKKDRRFNTACQMMAGMLSNETLTASLVNDTDGLVRLAFQVADKVIETEYPQ